jgi:hypothetical protein
MVHAQLCKGANSLSSSAGKRRKGKKNEGSASKYPASISEESDSLVQSTPSVSVKNKRRVEVDMGKKKKKEANESDGTDNATESDYAGATSSGQFGASSSAAKGAMSSTYTGDKDNSDSEDDSELSESATGGSTKTKMWEALKKKYLAAQKAEAMMGDDRESDSEISESK